MNRESSSGGPSRQRYDNSVPSRWAAYGRMMATINLTADDFEKTVLESDIVLVDFWAEWCGPCKQFGPVYEEASNQNPDITFGKIDTEAEQSLASAAGITSIPTLMAFREGVLVFAQPGALPAPMLGKVIGAVRDLDMATVRKDIEAQRATTVE
ncbi:MAG TPA: thioredoxin [Galbitalea sp.]